MFSVKETRTVIEVRRMTMRPESRICKSVVELFLQLVKDLIRTCSNIIAQVLGDNW
jgi:hypothetical protein